MPFFLRATESERKSDLGANAEETAKHAKYAKQRHPSLLNSAAGRLFCFYRRKQITDLPGVSKNCRSRGKEAHSVQKTQSSLEGI
jgi:hypothetical protein